MSAKNTSGQISLEDNTIVCSTSENAQWKLPAQWRLPISEVRVIGEFTNEAGPYLDDYFFLFVTSDATSWYCASFYADGRDKFLAELGNKLGVKLECKLCNSTFFKSRVMWPANLQETPLFEYVPEASPKNILISILNKFFPDRKVRLVKAVQLEAGLNLD